MGEPSTPTLSFPSDREGTETEYIYEVYIDFSVPGKKSIFFEIFPRREKVENSRDFPSSGKGNFLDFFLP